MKNGRMNRTGERKIPARQGLATLLCLILGFSAAACQPSNENKSTATGETDMSYTPRDAEKIPSDQPYFVSEELDFPSLPEGDSGEVISLMPSDAEVLVLLRITKAEPSDPATDGADASVRFVLIRYSLDGEKTGEITLGVGVDSTGTMLAAGRTANGFLAIVRSFDPETYAETIRAIPLDAKGMPAGDPYDLLFPQGFLPQSVRIDGSGNTYMSGIRKNAGAVEVCDATGHLVFDQPLNGTNGSFFWMDGMMYADGLDKNHPDQKGLYAIDLAKKNFGAKFDLSFAGTADNALFLGVDGVYTESETGLFRIDPVAKTTELLIPWSDCDAERTAMIGGKVLMLSDTAFMLFANKTDAGSKTSEVTASLVRRAQTNPNAGKTVLVLGGIRILDNPVISRQVYEFNRQSKAYYLVIKDYAEGEDWAAMDPSARRQYQAKIQAKLNLEMLSGDGPDILCRDAVGNSLAAQSQLFLDLETFLQNDTELSADDLLPCVRAACEKDGKMFLLSPGFRIAGLVGATSVIGNRSGWTYEEFLKVRDGLPDGMTMLTQYGLRQSDLLDIMLQGQLDTFLDPAAGKSGFQTQPFYDLLSFAKTVGKDDDAGVDPATITADAFGIQDESEIIRNRQIAVTHTNINSAEAYCLTVTLFGEPITVAGYPSEQQDSFYVDMETAFSVSAFTASPDGCWEFIKSFFTPEAQASLADDQANGMRYTYIPSTKAGFEKELLDATAIQADTTFNPLEGIRLVGVIGSVGTSTFGYLGEAFPMTEEMATAMRDLVNRDGRMPNRDPAIFSIIREEIPAYFNGQKTAEEVAALIDNRVGTLLQERK